MHIARHTVLRGALLGALVVVAGGAFAATSAAQAEWPTHAQREKMAQIHEQMAACLRSARPFAECRQEMMRACRAELGLGGCRMMQGGRPGGRRGGMMRGGGMMSPPGGPTANPNTPTSPPPR
jgi:hypothetical protein